MPKSRHRGRSVARLLALLGSTWCLAVTLIAAGTAPSFAAGTYRTTASVNVRSGPGAGYGLVGTEPSGAQFTLQCQWQGGTSVDGNATWDNVTFANGVTGAITDFYTTTPSWNSYAPGTGACGSSPASSSTSGSLGGVDMQGACNAQYPQYHGPSLKAVATNTGSAYSWRCVGPGVSLSIDVNAECLNQYGYGAISAVGNPASAWSWYCHWNVTSQMQNAANWARSQLNSRYSSYFGHNWSGWCEEFAEEAEGFPHPSYTNADADLMAQQTAGRFHPAGWNQTPPVGALVLYSGGVGHVAISIGNGEEIGTLGETTSDDEPITEYPVTGYLNNVTYQGWAFPAGS